MYDIAGVVCSVPILDYDDDVAAVGSGSTSNAMGTTTNVSVAAAFAVVDRS